MSHKNIRNVIVDIVCGRADHPTAEQIFEILTKELPQAEIKEVYECLDYLTGRGEIKRAQFPNEPFRYEGNTADHDHMVCLKCGAISDMPPVEVSMPEEIKKGNVRVMYHTLTVHCICSKCIAKLRLSSESKQKKYQKI